MHCIDHACACISLSHYACTAPVFSPCSHAPLFSDHAETRTTPPFPPHGTRTSDGTFRYPCTSVSFACLVSSRRFPCVAAPPPPHSGLPRFFWSLLEYVTLSLDTHHDTHTYYLLTFFDITLLLGSARLLCVVCDWCPPCALSRCRSSLRPEGDGLASESTDHHTPLSTLQVIPRAANLRLAKPRALTPARFFCVGD